MIHENEEMLMSSVKITCNKNNLIAGSGLESKYPNICSEIY